MKFRVRSQREFAAGLIFFSIGAIWLASSLSYRVGTATAMGPGYFPMVVSLILAGLGIGSVIRSLKFAEPDVMEPWPLVAIALVLGSVVGFGLLLESAGLIAAAAVLILLSCWSRLRARPFETLLLTVALIALVSGIFVFGLGMPVDLY
jgi:putative tricarboxylic transport membrane protein